MTRSDLLRKARGLEWLTLGWNVVEGIIAIGAAVAAGSVVLLGFGIDSFVECASSIVLLWRLYAERGDTERDRIERIDRVAHRLVGISLFALAAYVLFDASKALWLEEHPDTSTVGLVLTGISVPAMLQLSRVKRRVAAALESRALEADSFQTSACMWLSVIALVGAGANAALGLWWADPVAALGMTYFIAKEGREAWRGEDCCDGECHG